jgi:hypothetical protein
MLLVGMIRSGKRNHFVKHKLKMETLGDKNNHSNTRLSFMTMLCQMNFTQLLKRQ